VKDACAGLVSRGREKAFTGLLDEGDGIALGVFEGKAGRARFVFGDGGGVDLVREKIFAHFGEVWCGESDFGEEIVGCAAGNLLKLDALAAVDCVARIGDAEAGGRSGVEAENF